MSVIFFRPDAPPRHPANDVKTTKETDSIRVGKFLPSAV